MSTRLTTSRYISSFFIDGEKSVNNQTIDEQLAGSVKNIRPNLAKCIQNPKAIIFAENGFRASHDLYLECILRQTRTTGEDFTWDVTSKMNGVAHGRQLGVDALYYMRHGGFSTQTGQMVFEAAKLLMGADAESLYPYASPVRDVAAPGGPVADSSPAERADFNWAAYFDKKRQRYRFSGDCDMSTLKVEEDWE